MTERKYKRAVELLEAEINDELVALEPTAGNCFGFNRVATTVWQSLATPKSFEQIRDELLSRFDVEKDTCTRELEELLGDLERKGLIAPCQTAFASVEDQRDER